MRQRRVDYSDVERQLVAIFDRLIFAPVEEQIAMPELTNASEGDVRKAIRSGQLTYSGGVFSGRLSARVSLALRAMGARFDKRTGRYKLEASQVPAWVSAESAALAVRAREVHEKIARKLDRMQESLGAPVAEKVDASGVVGRVDAGFRDVAKKLEIGSALTEDAKDRLAEGYSKNMDLWINKWRESEIKELREAVERNARAGYRMDGLIDSIRHRKSVSDNKARFLARQETALFMAEFRKQRVTSAGFTHYVWRGSRDERERPDHRALEGRVFSYDSPPIVDRATGRRGNPGQDFGCRCVDVPVVGGLAEEVAA